MNTQKFEGVSKTAIDKFVAELGANVTSVQAEGQAEVTYTILDNGFHAIAVWNEAASTLLVNVLGKPWYIPVEIIWQKLEYDLKNSPEVKEEEKEKEN